MQQAIPKGRLASAAAPRQEGGVALGERRPMGMLPLLSLSLDLWPSSLPLSSYPCPPLSFPFFLTSRWGGHEDCRVGTGATF